jgi:hypothetical protein
MSIFKKVNAYCLLLVGSLLFMPSVNAEVVPSSDLRGYIVEIYDKSPGYITIEKDTFIVPARAKITENERSLRLRELEKGMEVIYTLEDKKIKKYPAIKTIEVIVK